MASSVKSHQPRQAIWSLFDKVLVLGKGYQLFYGTPSDAELWFTDGLGLYCPPHTSYSDFIMDQANIDFCKEKIYPSNATLTTMDKLKEVRQEHEKRRKEGRESAHELPSLPW